MTDLDPSGLSVDIGRVSLIAPGLCGTVEVYRQDQLVGKTRSAQAERTTHAFELAIERSKVKRQQTIVISNTREIPSINTEDFKHTKVFIKPAIKLQIPAPNSNWGQMVLAVDESGINTWSFAACEENSQNRTYLIPRYVPKPSDTGPKDRGLASAVGKKIMKEFIFPLFEEELGELGQYYAAKWEAKNRPYCIRTFTPDDYNQPNESSIDDEGWKRLSNGRALFMIHGTFSRAHNAFADLPKETVTELNKMYPERVFAFDHFTLSDDPVQNVKKLIELIPEGTKLDLDIICHSRGGLVSRVLSEMQSELSLGSRRLKIGRIIFVASPNSGTILTDDKYMGSFIDAHTNILDFFPTNGVTDIFEGIIVTAKMLAIGASGALPGLQSMLPNGKFINSFNIGQRTNTQYYALTSHFGTKHFGLMDLLGRITDCIFHEPNDLVVPTQGVYENNLNVNFPIEKHFEFQHGDEVSHSGYFSKLKSQEMILKWLAKA